MSEEEFNETCIFCGRDIASFPNMRLVQSGVPGDGDLPQLQREDT